MGRVARPEQYQWPDRLTQAQLQAGATAKPGTGGKHEGPGGRVARQEQYQWPDRLTQPGPRRSRGPGVRGRAESDPAGPTAGPPVGRNRGPEGQQDRLTQAQLQAGPTAKPWARQGGRGSRAGPEAGEARPDGREPRWPVDNSIPGCGWFSIRVLDSIPPQRSAPPGVQILYCPGRDSARPG